MHRIAMAGSGHEPKLTLGEQEKKEAPIGVNGGGQRRRAKGSRRLEGEGRMAQGTKQG